jgi:hypothetical protein
MATVSQSIRVVGGGVFDVFATSGTVFFTLAPNQYALLTIYPNCQQLAIGIPGIGSCFTNAYPESTTAFPFEVHVPTGGLVSAAAGGTVAYTMTWIIYQSP